MSAELYQMISIIAFICGGIFTIAAVVLFIKFDIPALIGELSGKTAEKKVQEIREQNRQAVAMRQRGSERRRKVLLYDAKAENAIGDVKISKVTSRTLQEPKVIQDESTEVLAEQTVLLDEATEVLAEQTVLSDESTEVLTEQTVLLDEADDFCIVEDVVEVHTVETI